MRFNFIAHGASSIFSNKQQNLWSSASVCEFACAVYARKWIQEACQRCGPQFYMTQHLNPLKFLAISPGSLRKRTLSHSMRRIIKKMSSLKGGERFVVSTKKTHTSYSYLFCTRTCKPCICFQVPIAIELPNTKCARDFTISMNDEAD